MKHLESMVGEVVSISRETAHFISKEAKSFKMASLEEKGFHDLVSYVDRTAEQMLVAALRKLLPEAGFMAEESGSSLAGRYNWIIDPLDGTTNFVHGIPIYSISIALQESNKTILGLVYEINQNECFYTWKDGPAILNSKQIRVSETNILANSLIATGFPYSDFSRLQPYLELFNTLTRSTRGLRRLGSAAVDLAYVACGRFEAFYEYGLHPWDVAAGCFLVEQAGGTLSTFDGGSDVVFGTDIIASNGYVHNELSDEVRKHFGMH
jgi:myo-inositol-1(or 4)-monophosphatase